MIKYSQHFKQQVIEFYLQHQENRALTRQYLGLEKSILRLWIAQHKHSLAVLTCKRYYSPEFKLKVIQSLMAGQISAYQASLKFGIASASLISQWLNAFEKRV